MTNRLRKLFKKTDTSDVQQLVRLWLESFQLCVNQQDYATAKTLFSPSVLGFGTIAPIAIGLEQLVEQQWKKRWPTSESFQFNIEDGKILVGNPFVACCLLWSGVNKDGTKREGRATLIWHANQEQGGGMKLRCCHSHFSSVP